jgi:hypothetical protein
LKAVLLSQIVQRERDSGMIGTERFLVNCQRSVPERLGIGIAALTPIEYRNPVEGIGDIGMIGTERFFPDR